MKRCLNLIPTEQKDKQFNKQLILAFIAVVGVFVFFAAVQYVQIGWLHYRLDVLQKENTQYNLDKERLAELENEILENTEYIAEHNRTLFPFNSFMSDIQRVKPSSVNIISVDSADRLAEITEIAYNGDLSGNSLTLRGNCPNANDVSSYIDSLSKLDSVSDLRLTGIEEKSSKEVVFEVMVKVR